MRSTSLLLLLFWLPALSFAQKANVLLKVDSLISNTEYDQALKLLDQSKPEDDQAKVLLDNKAAEILIIQGKLDEAETKLKNITNLNSEFGKAITLSNIGFLYLNKGRYDLALENLQAALSKFQSSGNQNTKEGAKCLSTLGLVYGSTHKYKQAEENHVIAMQIRDQLFGPESEDVAASYNDLGLIYLETDPDKALEYFEKALTSYRKVHGKNHPKIAISSTNIGFAYRKLELFGDAIVNFENAKTIWEKIYPEGHPNQALVLSYLGQIYRQMNDSKAAMGYFKKSLEQYKKSFGEKHSDIASTFNELGILAFGEHRYQEAIHYFQKSIIANSPLFNNTDIKQNPHERDYYNGFILLYSLRWKAQALETNYYSSSLKLEDLKLALRCLHACDSLIDDIRHHSSDETDKIALGEIANEVYEDGVRIAQSVSEIIFNATKYKEEAFYFAEKSKSAVLQESIAEAQAKSFAGIPNDLLEEEINLKSSITFLNQKISLKPEADEEKKMRENLFSLNLQYEAFIKRLEKQYPKYYDLKFNQTMATVGSLQNSLNAETAIISFFVAEKGKRIYQFVITKKNFKISNSTLPENFDRLVRGLNNSLYYSDFETFKKSSLPLSRVLVSRLPPSIKQIVIVPSGRLGTIPFEALPLNAKSMTHFDGVKFLLEKYAISYEFATALMLQRDSNASNQAASIYLCAPIQFPEKDNLNELPGTEKEVTAIASLFSKSSYVAKFQEANETNIKAATLSSYDYLHFATHGIVDETEPELSRIFLNTGNKDDGHLFSGEIYNLQLKAQLAVLSACQTGLGKLSKGEGVIGLSRALTYAGAKNIIVSFWSVADESTAELMTSFYKRLIEDDEKNFSMALRQAKLQLIKSRKFSTPYYWAPFVLIGK
jgi:CHAT domain-containing protein